MKKKTIMIWSPYMGHVGTIRAVLNIARGLAAEGHEVHLIRLYREWEGQEAFLERHGVRLIDFGARKLFRKLPTHGAGYRFSMGLLSLFSFPKLLFLLRRQRPDVMLVCLLGFLPMLAIRFLKPPPRTILSVQGIPTFNLLRRYLWTHLQSRADVVVPLTENTRRLLARNGIPVDKMYRINNPIVAEDIDELAAREPDHPWFREDAETPILIGIGRLTRQKDFGTLLAAFSLLRKNRPCRLVILGEGEDRPLLESEIARLGLEEDVWLAGFVSNPYQYLSRAKVFVLSSLWEDPGHVLIEAAFLRIPIVATDCPSGPRDFLDEGRLGLLVPMSDPASMAQAVGSVLDESTVFRAERVRLAYERSLAYTIPECVRGYSQLLEENEHNQPHLDHV